jgi:hypothetical protein
MTIRRALAAAGLTALIVPTAAVARGGPAGGGGAQPVPSSAACATLTSDTPGQVLSGGGAARIRQRWTAGNCSNLPETLTVTVSPRTFWLTPGSNVANFCTGTPFVAGNATLKPGEKRSVEIVVPPDPCYVRAQPLNIVYDAAISALPGQTLAAAESGVTVRLVP